MRELPALLAVIEDLDEPPGLVIVDGYVDLDPDGRPGLGAHLNARLGVPVIGVANALRRVDALARGRDNPDSPATGHRGRSC